MVHYSIQQYTVYNIGYSGENSFVVYSYHSGYVFFIILYKPVAPVAQRYNVTSDTLGREFDPGKRVFSH